MWVSFLLNKNYPSEINNNFENSYLKSIIYLLKNNFFLQYSKYDLIFLD